MTSPRRALESLPDDVTDAAEPTPRRALDGHDVVAAPRRRRLAVGIVSGLAVLGLGTGLVFAASGRGATEAVPAATPTAGSRSVEELSRGSVEREPQPEQTETPPASTPPEPVAIAAVAPSTSATPESRQTMYTTTNLNLRAEPNPSAHLMTVLGEGTVLTALGPATGGWQKVSSGAGTGYVNAEYLTTTAPAKPSASAASAKPSASPSAAGKDLGSSTNSPCGSNIDSGITDRAVSVKRAICTNYPDVQNFLGRRGDGEHSSGRAIDVMVSGARGREIAGWLRAHASELGVIEVIYEQKIWTQQRSGEGWRQMSDRGGRTANHYDHIHVLVR